MISVALAFLRWYLAGGLVMLGFLVFRMVQSGMTHRIAERWADNTPAQRRRFIVWLFVLSVLLYPVLIFRMFVVDDDEKEGASDAFRRDWLDNSRVAQALRPQMPAGAEEVIFVQRFHEFPPWRKEGIYCTYSRECLEKRTKASLVILFSRRCQTHGHDFLYSVHLCAEHEHAHEEAVKQVANSFSVPVREAPFAHTPWSSS